MRIGRLTVKKAAPDIVVQ